MDLITDAVIRRQSVRPLPREHEVGTLHELVVLTQPLEARILIQRHSEAEVGHA